MKVIIEGKALTVYKAPDYYDKDSGETTPGKYKLQLLVESELMNGQVKQEMKDISIPDDRVKEFEGQIGKPVQLKCDFVSKTSVNFYVK
ncbi:hypothetical protein LOH54_02435 [Sulfurimonas sp. HSL-3221]|uniref:hypothetical protein n=1 Tax=Sulfurimonadaceae TaxID=2771471 RepID=UPI001E5308B5|nr:hypothetical protein [Sulfurimonas sp. HSL-3221]UFS62992.1 hypothetical protein LOH54_02435 [Sulfurimonas sp. HSL-3221]